MLNLPQLQQTKVVETDGQYEIHVTATAGVEACGCLTPQLVKNGTKPAMFFDTPMHGKKVGIWVIRQRHLCRSCGRTAYSRVPHMHHKHDMTERLVAYIEQAGAARTFTAIASEVGIDPQTVSGIWNAYAREKLDELGPQTPEWMGIDELFIMKAYRCVITNTKDRTLVDMLPNRKKMTVISYLGGVMESERIKVVTMDMWDDYREAVRIALPHATIIVDRFHIMQHASNAVEIVRKQLRAGLNTKKRLGLIGDRWLFRTAREKLSAPQTMVLEAILEQYPSIKGAYHFKESFRDVWQVSTRAEAEARYADWKAQVEASEVAEAFKPLTTALTNWHTEAFNFMDLRLTNAYTEGMNSLARRMDRMGRGYSFNVLRAKLLLMYSAHKRGEPIVFTRSRPVREQRSALPAGVYGMMRSTPEPEVITEPGPFLGLDISTLADEVAKWPESG